MKINRSKILHFIGVMASFIAIAALALVILHARSLRWKLFTDYYVSFSILCFILLTAFAATIGILYARRTILISLVKTNKFKFTIFIIAAMAGFYFKFSALEFLLFLYAVYAILFIRQSLVENKLYQSIHKLADHFLAGLFTIDSRTPALFAELFILFLPLLIIFNKTAAVEQIIVYVFYLLVIVVILQIMEVKLKIERENYLLTILKNSWNALYKAVADKKHRTRIIISIRSNFRHFITDIIILYLAGLIVFFALIYAAKYMYWEKAFIQAYSQIFDFNDLKTASPYAEEIRALPFGLLPGDLIEVEVSPGAPLSREAMAYFILYQTPHMQETLVFHNNVVMDSDSAFIANIVTHRMRKPTLIWRNWRGNTALPATRIILTVWRPKKAFTRAYSQTFDFNDLKTASPYAEEMRKLPFGLRPGDLIEVEVSPGAPLSREAMAYFILYQTPHVQETLVFQHSVVTDNDSAHIANIVTHRMEKPTLIWRNWYGNAVLPATRIILTVWRPKADM